MSGLLLLFLVFSAASVAPVAAVGEEVAEARTSRTSSDASDELSLLVLHAAVRARNNGPPATADAAMPSMPAGMTLSLPPDLMAAASGIKIASSGSDNSSMPAMAMGMPAGMNISPAMMTPGMLAGMNNVPPQMIEEVLDGMANTNKTINVSSLVSTMPGVPPQVLTLVPEILRNFSGKKVDIGSIPVAMIKDYISGFRHGTVPMPDLSVLGVPKAMSEMLMKGFVHPANDSSKDNESALDASEIQPVKVANYHVPYHTEQAFAHRGHAYGWLLCLVVAAAGAMSA